MHVAFGRRESEFPPTRVYSRQRRSASEAVIKRRESEFPPTEERIYDRLDPQPPLNPPYHQNEPNISSRQHSLLR